MMVVRSNWRSCIQTIELFSNINRNCGKKESARNGQLRRTCNKLHRSSTPPAEGYQVLSASRTQLRTSAAVSATDPSSTPSPPGKDEWYDRKLYHVRSDPDGHPDWKLENNQLFYFRKSFAKGELEDPSEDWKLVVPYRLRARILRECHDDPQSGHMGLAKTHWRIGRLYYWPSMYEDIARYIRKCDVCQRVKPINHAPRGLMYPRYLTGATYSLGRNYKRKKGYSVMTEEQFNSARSYIQKGFSIRQAAKEIGFDEKTVRNRLKAGTSRGKFGRYFTFTKEQERDLVNHCIELDKRFFGLTLKSLRFLLFSYAEENKISHQFSQYNTIDEQLVGFCGNCPFRIYIPNKPAKYGLKVLAIVDSGTKYLFDAIPYIGKGTTPPDEPVAPYIVKKLVETIKNTNRNVTFDNWFTSVPLALDLLQKGITCIGTIRKNKNELPPQFVDLKLQRSKVGSSRFLYHDDITAVSYKAKTNKMVTLISTMHDQSDLHPYSKKPQIIHSYNATKGGVDTLDQLCSNNSCNRKTKRWPMCFFYNILNVACVNSYLIYKHNFFRRQEQKRNGSQTGTIQTTTTSTCQPSLPQALHLTLEEQLRGNLSRKLQCQFRFLLTLKALHSHQQPNKNDIDWAEPYQGAGTCNPVYAGCGLGYSVVLSYFDKLPLQDVPYQLFFDNLFTSTQLLKDLYDRRILATGTMRANLLSIFMKSSSICRS
ncbi:unnamed protein product [Nesidiocoris tenuis]|uniref:PiggyBac transposable element-derived protein domain-containing protein n=1 Tax=Nesidiocoris tenuis TaxID=355587 RepID=A0A6H5HBB9_9HEMI|nr:unnamed protein product [Nesidiocoris tenuis]